MGGSETKYEGFINFDKNAVGGGINDDVKNFGKYFGNNTVSEVVVNNPQANFIEEISPAMKSDAVITVRGTLSNKYFNQIYTGKVKGLDDYNIIETKPTETTGFKRTDGTPVKGEIREIKLTKKGKK